MEVKWYEKAQQHWDEQLTYCAETFGRQTALKSIQTVEEKIESLCRFPESGTPEPLLKDEKQLYRKLKQLTGMSTVEYIRSIRLKKAAILLQNGNFTISEVMYSVGFSNASYFTRAFSSEFGKSPSEYKRYYSPKV